MGWADARSWGGLLTEDRLRRFGAVARRGDSARLLLDAALSSPSGRGVVVDQDGGGVVGTVLADDVLEALDAQDAWNGGARNGGAPHTPQPAGADEDRAAETT